MSIEEHHDVPISEIVKALTEATNDGTTILLAGFSVLTVEEFAVTAIAELEESGVGIEIVTPGRDYRVQQTGGAITACALSEPGVVAVSPHRPVLILVIPGDDWPDGVEQQAAGIFNALVDHHPIGGTVITRDPS